MERQTNGSGLLEVQQSFRDCVVGYGNYLLSLKVTAARILRADIISHEFRAILWPFLSQESYQTQIKNSKNILSRPLALIPSDRSKDCHDNTTPSLLDSHRLCMLIHGKNNLLYRLIDVARQGKTRGAEESTKGFNIYIYINDFPFMKLSWQKRFRARVSAVQFCDDVMTWKRFLHYWPVVRETTVHRWIHLTQGQ